MALSKRDIIAQLEGRELCTADGSWHLVRNGTFTSQTGETVPLDQYSTPILRDWLKRYSRPVRRGGRQNGLS